MGEEPKPAPSPAPKPTSSVEKGSLAGSVMGYIDKDYTRPMFPAYAFLLIHVTNQDNGDELVFYPASKKDLGPIQMKFKGKHDVLGMEDLEQMAPELAAIIGEHIKSFSPFEITTDNALARFEFKDIPLGWWCYVVGAMVEKQPCLHTDTMGNDGLGAGKNGAINGNDLLKSKDKHVDGIIVPVEDAWLKKFKPAEHVHVTDWDKGHDPHVLDEMTSDTHKI